MSGLDLFVKIILMAYRCCAWSDGLLLVVFSTVLYIYNVVCYADCGVYPYVNTLYFLEQKYRA